MFTHIDSIPNKELKNLNAKFRQMIINFAKENNMTQEVAKQFVANIGCDYDYELSHNNTIL